jgi:hypothetical protein
MNLGKIIKYVQMWFISTYYGYLKAARWNVSVRVTKNYGIEKVVNIWVKSPWPAKGNSLIHDCMKAVEVRSILIQYDLYDYKSEEYKVDFTVLEVPNIEIFGISNQRGPVGYTSEFVTKTYQSEFVMPGTEIDPPKPKPVNNPRK